MHLYVLPVLTPPVTSFTDLETQRHLVCFWSRRWQLCCCSASPTIITCSLQFPPLPRRCSINESKLWWCLFILILTIYESQRNLLDADSEIQRAKSVMVFVYMTLQFRALTLLFPCVEKQLTDPYLWVNMHVFFELQTFSLLLETCDTLGFLVAAGTFNISIVTEYLQHHQQGEYSFVLHNYPQGGIQSPQSKPWTPPLKYSWKTFPVTLKRNWYIFFPRTFQELYRMLLSISRYEES